MRQQRQPLVQGPSKRRYEFPTTDADVIDERHSKFMKHKHWHTHYIKKNSQEQSNSQVTLGGVKFETITSFVHRLLTRFNFHVRQTTVGSHILQFIR